MQFKCIKSRCRVKTKLEQEDREHLLDKELSRSREINEPTSLIKHDIRLIDYTPIKQRHRPRP